MRIEELQHRLHLLNEGDEEIESMLEDLRSDLKYYDLTVVYNSDFQAYCIADYEEGNL